MAQAPGEELAWELGAATAGAGLGGTPSGWVALDRVCHTDVLTMSVRHGCPSVATGGRVGGRVGTGGGFRRSDKGHLLHRRAQSMLSWEMGGKWWLGLGARVVLTLGCVFPPPRSGLLKAAALAILHVPPHRSSRIHVPIQPSCSSHTTATRLDPSLRSDIPLEVPSRFCFPRVSVSLA